MSTPKTNLKRLPSSWRVILISAIHLGLFWIGTDQACIMAEDDFDSTRKTFLSNHCVSCHGPDQSEADLRLDQLSQPSSKTLLVWEEVARQVQTKNMPPSDSTQPSQVDRATFLHQLGIEISRASPPVPALRRMSRTEYEHTVQDLLGIDTPLKDLLPEDSEVQGFDNVATGLDISSILMERYLESANAAFEGAIRRIEPLPPSTRRVTLVEQKDNKDSIAQNKGGVIAQSGAFVDFTPGWPPARIDPAHPIEDGIYRCKVAVWPHEPGPERTLAVGIYVGPLFGPGKRKFIGTYDVTGTPESPRVIEFTCRMAEGHTLHILPMVYPEHVTWRDKEEPRPGVAIAWAETFGPLDQTFPAPATQQLFGNSSTIESVPTTPLWMRHRKGVKTHIIESSAPKTDSEQIIQALSKRAFDALLMNKLLNPSWILFMTESMRGTRSKNLYGQESQRFCARHTFCC